MPHKKPLQRSATKAAAKGRSAAKRQSAADALHEAVWGVSPEPQEVDPSPWAVGRGERLVYLERPAGEGAMTTLRRFFRYDNKVFTPAHGGAYAGGSCGGFSWLVEVPSGETFIGLVTQKDHAGWMKRIRAFAEADARLVATVKPDGKRLVLSDGRRVSWKRCACRRVTPADD